MIPPVKTWPIEWLVDQHVPLVFFLAALLTQPSTWSRVVVNAIRKRFGSDDG